jgi:lysozyme
VRHSDACRLLVAQFEGLRLSAYPDPGTGADPWTIGYGHTGPEVRKGLIWTPGQADDALDADLDRFDIGVSSLIDGHLTTQSQLDAMVSFAFNLGLGALGKSTLLKMHLAGDYGGAQAEFGKWVNGAGKPMPGLVKRRAAEAAMYGQMS